MNITVEIKHVYGNERIFPITHTQELFTITGTKTLSRKQIEALKSLGFTFEVKAQEL